jgi:2,5-dihydroxypyridine 5,6-dioxygenase
MIKAELARSIEYFFRDILLLEKGEKILVFSDTRHERPLINAFKEVAHKMGFVIDVAWVDTINKLSEIINYLVDRINSGRYDVIIELSRKYFYPTAIWKTSKQKGCRLFALGALNEDSFKQCIGEVNNSKMYDFGLILYKIIKKSKSIQILTKAGTNVSFRMATSGFISKLLETFKIVQFLSRLKIKLKRSMVMMPTGKLSKKSSTTFMGGQLTFRGIPETMVGTIVIDGFLWPPENVGLIEEPIVLKVNKGYVTSIEGNHQQAIILREWLENKSKRVEHLCIGFNPGCRLGKDIMEAERAFGQINVGIGTYPFHTDGIIKNPTLIVDNSVILQNHSFLQKDLLILQNDLSLQQKQKSV